MDRRDFVGFNKEKALKSLILSLIILTLTSCNEIEPRVSAANNDAQLQENSFGRWLNTSATPITPLIITSQFTIDEQNAATNMAAEWEQAVDNELNFYNLPFQEVPGLPVINNYTDLEQYNDAEMGIYKSFDWFENVSSFALAITLFRGFQRNSGTPDTFIELIHADIIMNYRDWDFSTDNTPFTYDFQSVVLHEIGHFIGLPHVFSTEDAVMYPSLNLGEVKRVPFAIDEQNSMSNYGITGGGGVSSIIGTGIAAINAPENNRPIIQNDVNIDDRGEEVQGYIELRTDGTCHHYINGKLVHSH